MALALGCLEAGPKALLNIRENKVMMRTAIIILKAVPHLRPLRPPKALAADLIWL